MEVWEKHLSAVLQGRETLPLNNLIPAPKAIQDSEKLTVGEILATIQNSKDNKSCGPDNIFNEHLKATLQS
jgi:hypothetical protein